MPCLSDRTCYFIPVQVVHDIWVLVFPHDQDLINNQLFLRLLLKVHLLNGHLKSEYIQCATRVIHHLLSTN